LTNSLKCNKELKVLKMGIKCPNCGYVSNELKIVRLKGEEPLFPWQVLGEWKEYRCPKCGHILFRAPKYVP
jgi:DNA-directed RNA polymerase subunit RPC12/RpoP